MVACTSIGAQRSQQLLLQPHAYLAMGVKLSLPWQKSRFLVLSHHKNLEPAALPHNCIP